MAQKMKKGENGVKFVLLGYKKNHVALQMEREERQRLKEKEIS